MYERKDPKITLRNTLISSGVLLSGAVLGGISLNTMFQEKLFSKCLEYIDSEVISNVVTGINNGIDLKPDEQALILGVVGGLYALTKVANCFYNVLESKNSLPRYI